MTADGPASDGEWADRERALCHLLHRAAQGLDAHAREVGDAVGLSAVQAIALRELDEPITARELAGRMSCEPSNVTFVLDRLEGQGLIERRPHPADRRAKQLTLTAEGARRRRDVVARLSARSPLEALTGAQRASLVELLDVLVTER